MEREYLYNSMEPVLNRGGTTVSTWNKMKVSKLLLPDDETMMIKTPEILVPKTDLYKVPVNVSDIGIMGPKLEQPVNANSPIILAPNIPGGMVTKQSPVYDAATKVPRTEMELTPINSPANSTASVPTKTASFTLPNSYIMIGMILAVIVLFYFTRKK